MKNIQISFDEEILKTIDRLAAVSKQTRSFVVREAVKAWIRQKQVDAFEDEWIQKLKETPQDVKDSDAWIKAEQWGDE
jgi:predicted transcriptional regulator